MEPVDKRRLEEEFQAQYSERDPEVEGYELIDLEGPEKVRNPQDNLGEPQHRYYATFEDPFGGKHTYSVNFNSLTRCFGTIKRASGK